MNILIISPEFPPSLSGMGDYGYHLAVHLQQLGHSVTVLSDCAEAPEKETVHGVTIIRGTKRWDTASWPHIRSLIKSGSFQIVHIQYLNLSFKNLLFIHFLPLMIRMQCHGVKTAVTFHEFSAPWKRAALLPLFLFSDACIVTNDHHLQSLGRLFKKILLSKRIYRIPLAANILPKEENLKKRDAVREQLGVLPDETLFVRFGILHDISAPGILTVLDSLKSLTEKKKPVKLLLIGKEEAAAKQLVVSRIRSLGMEDKVLLKTNAAPDLVSAYLYAADIGLGLYPDGVSEKRTAFLSLLAHGLPVIATQRGKLPSELVAGKNIITVPYDAPAAVWSETLEKVTESDLLRREIKAGGDQFSARHQWKKIAESTAVLYHQLKDGL